MCECTQRFLKNKDEMQHKNTHNNTGKQLTLSENTGFFPVKDKQQTGLEFWTFSANHKLLKHSSLKL